MLANVGATIDYLRANKRRLTTRPCPETTRAASRTIERNTRRGTPDHLIDHGVYVVQAHADAYRW